MYTYKPLCVFFSLSSSGLYGACFYPPAKVLLDDEAEPQLSIYASRPGLRLWTADLNGKVQATLMYKGLMNENPPGIRTLTPLPSPSLAAATRIDQFDLALPQFGRLQIFHGQFVITWDLHRLWVLDTSPCALVCYHHSYHGDICDVCTVGHEVYVLQHKGERLIKKFSLIPKFPNPLLQVRKLLLNSTKLEPEKDISAVEKKPASKEEEEAVSSAVAERQSIDNSIQSSPEDQHDRQQDLAALAAKLQGVVNEDYGDIVFRPRKSKRKQKYPGKF